MWQKKKYGKKLYQGSYRFVTGEREFILVGMSNGKKNTISFESHEAAKTNGWKKL